MISEQIYRYFGRPSKIYGAGIPDDDDETSAAPPPSGRRQNKITIGGGIADQDRLEHYLERIGYVADFYGGGDYKINVDVDPIIVIGGDDDLTKDEPPIPLKPSEVDPRLLKLFTADHIPRARMNVHGGRGGDNDSTDSHSDNDDITDGNDYSDDDIHSSESGESTDQDESEVLIDNIAEEQILTTAPTDKNPPHDDEININDFLI